ncbi:MAG: SDR family NAD(P)-dependent oxidoreductase [Ilumatobacteraceae bacterium]
MWFITGAGRGIGRALTDAALAAGERVVATVRRPDAVADLVAAHGNALHVEMLDVRDRGAVDAAVRRGIEHHGRLDVVVNNAGYGVVGTIEELAEDDLRDILDTNVLGAVWVTQAVLPHLRGQGSGHIVQISTVGGVGTMPTLGAYNASKWALEAFSEALAAEVGPLGVRVTIAELGGFATDWGGSSMHFAEPLPVYDQLRTDLFGTPVVPWPQADDELSTDAPPADAAHAIRAHVDADTGPLRLLVGEDAPTFVASALAARRDDYGRDARFTWPAGPTAGSSPAQ